MARDNSIAWQALGRLGEEAARRHDVVPDLHPSDFILLFLLEHPGFRDDKGRVDYYFDDGARSARSLAALVADTCRIELSSLRLLEFASGYGCVTRHLRGALPGASVTSCDIHPEAVEFIQRKVGATAIGSHSVPEQLKLADRYDVVFALSFFSHMPKTSWGRWLRALADGVRESG